MPWDATLKEYVMSQFSKALLLIGWMLGFVLLLYYKGSPTIPAPNPQAIADVTFQPFLAVVWGIVRYLFDALWFSLLVVFAVKIVRVMIQAASHPEETIAAFFPSKAPKEGVQ
ncbi:hypothetical protein GCM10017784_11030 [Deinococcus indicus]|nr:hypothetical protein GCM10017784_11030 [Deinococcus indicus]